MTPPRGATTWTAVVPVKAFSAAKSRLRAVVGDDTAALAAAFAADTVTAVAGADLIEHVVVVGPPVQRSGGTLDTVLDDPGTGLNDAVRHGIGWVRERHPRAAILVVTSDLPALRSVDVNVLLKAAEDHVDGAVPDLEGRGTTALTLRPGSSLLPAFGEGSWRRHLRAGADPLDGAASPRLRRDVDTLEHVVEAARMGIGQHSAVELRRVAGTTLAAMQATVATFDAATGGGSVLLDDGLVLDFDGRVFAQSGLRLLRPGQRVTLSLDPSRGDRVVAALVLIP
ncbi:MAG: 2-phospho-L-lactate guanylyltransferase [Nocardioidaceae bacterium]